MFTVPYFFVRSFRYATSYRHGYLDTGIIVRGGGGGGGEKNRGTAIPLLQLVFTERVLPATQAFDWSLDHRC